eukprot:TRINITY_DN10198_c1_g1_i2.p1 TRINITY_DN10198_c1_g1~~TRINITY_DN10198_c1_g1_i2.p1  ORF type:complete len:401 (-),score=109.32 TRINITY_DN10198_c1_g1_i2:76-1221(-)
MGNRQIEAYKQAAGQPQPSGGEGGEGAPKKKGASASGADTKAFLEELEAGRIKWRNAALAFLQGTHARTGEHSAVSHLPVDLLSTIVFMFRPSVPLVATCCPSGVVRVWELNFMRLVHSFPTSNAAYTMKITDRMVIGGLQRGIEAWDLWDGKQRPAASLPAVQGTVWCVDAKRDTLACAHTDRTLTVWDLSGARKEPRGPVACSDWVHCVLVAAADLVLCGLRGGVIEVWSAAGTGAPTRVRKLEKHNEAVTCMQVLNPAGGARLVTGSYDTTLKLWDLDTGACLRTFTDHTAGVLSLCVKGDILVSGSGNNVKVWNLSTGEVRQTLPHDEALCVSVLDDAHVISGGADAEVRVWDFEAGNVVTTLHNSSQVFYMEMIYL